MTNSQYTPTVQRALRKLGDDLQVARKRRRMTVDDFAERLGVSKNTLIRLERGEAGTSVGTLAMALLVLGELPRLSELIDMSRDDTGLLLDRNSLPERIRRPRRSRPQSPKGTPGVDPGGMAF